MNPARLVLGLLLSSNLLTAALTPREERIAAWPAAHREDFARDLETAVNIDSATENLAGVRRMGEVFAAQLRELGFEARFEELPASTGRAGHLVAERKGTRGRKVLLIGHLDTVLPGGNFRREGDRVFGSGTSDMKGGDLIIIHALRALQAADALDGAQITVVMTGDEEAVGQPQEITRRALREAAARCDLALSFEGDIAGTATVARRSSNSWALEVQGATGHSSGIFSDAMGTGAVYEAARIITAFYGEMRQFDGLTLNPGIITGGATAELDRTGGTAAGKTNIVAQRVHVRGDLRTLSPEQLAAAQAKMREIVARHLPRTSATLVFNEGYPAMPETPANHALLAQLDAVSRDLGQGPITAFDPRGRGAGDVAFVSPPLPAIDGLGMGGGQQEHAPGENADLATVPGLIARAAVLIHRLTR